jgi:hypothetical protein
MHLFEEIICLLKKNETAILYLKYNAYSREPVLKKKNVFFSEKSLRFPSEMHRISFEGKITHKINVSVALFLKVIHVF